jgi:flagellar basal body-associated protein FliL
MPTATQAQTKAAPSHTRSVVFSVLAVMLLGAGMWFWSTKGTGTGSADRSGAVKSSLHLDTFVLNLADREQRSYLRVGIDLGLGRAMGKGESGPPVGQVRDTILGVLSQARVDDLLTAPGKAKLKEDLLGALQERVPGLDVQDVYFTEFLIQR